MELWRGRNNSGHHAARTDRVTALTCLILGIIFFAPVATAQNAEQDRQKKLEEIQRKLQQESKRAKAGKSKTTTKPFAKIVAEKSTYFLEVPLIGPIGSDLSRGWGNNAVTLERTLSYAANNGIKHVIFHIDSPGGHVAEADAMVAVMDKYADRLTYHALIKRAISAAIWIVFNSDTVHIMDKGTVGGAVPYSQDEVGNIQVSEKINSIIAAKLAAAAESKGHSSVLVKSMILMGSEAYSWKDGSGKRRITASRPTSPKARDIEALDNEKTVLTLTANESERIGFATKVASSKEVGAVIKARNWRRANFYGYVLVLNDQAFRNQTIKLAVETNFRMLSQQEIIESGHIQPGYFEDAKTGVIVPFLGYKGTRETFIKQIQRLKMQLTTRFSAVVKRIEDTDPERTVRIYDAATKQLSASYIQDWRARKRNCITAWRSLKGAQTMGVRYFKQCGPNLGDQYPPQAIMDIWQRSEKMLKQLEPK